LFYSKGIGEFPLLMQATFSIWSSTAAMMHFAYYNPKYAEIIKKIRVLNCYSEKLFLCFEPYQMKWSLISKFI